MSEEKTKITSEPHDGIGGIMTNINFLVEIAKGNPTGEKLETALSRISSLSKDGLSEIRSFMRSFDGKETSFDSLVADFRLYGSETMKPHDFEFNIETKNEVAGSRPAALFYLHIFRIYKESLVNILKHSKATKVDVKLNITEKAIELIIQDDGSGLKPSAHQGRGILNMKSKAEEMGGRLTITSKNGTQVHFTISTPEIPQQ